MSWKQILKIDMEEARQLGDKYAPDEMEEDRIKRRKSLMVEDEEILRGVIEQMKNEEKTSPRKEDRYRYALQMYLRKMPNPPRLRGKNLDQMISIVEDYLEGKQTTNLIDRAKKANRDDPRMGSGRDSERKSAGPVSSKTSGVHRVSYSERDKDGKSK